MLLARAFGSVRSAVAARSWSALSLPGASPFSTDSSSSSDEAAPAAAVTSSSPAADGPAAVKPSQAQFDKLMEGFSRPQGVADGRSGERGTGRFGGGLRGGGSGNGGVVGRYRVPPAGGRDGNSGVGGRLAGEHIHPTKIFEPGMSYKAEDLDWSQDAKMGAEEGGAGQVPQRPRHFRTYTPPGAGIKDEDAGKLFEPFNVALLAKFVNPQGKIMKRQQTGLSAKSQRKVAKAIKTSRQLGLMPYDSRPRIQRY